MSSQTFAPFRHRSWALMFGAGLVSNMGSWLQAVAVGALVTAQTGQARWASLVAAAAFLPLGLLGPVGGALADRFDRRRMLILFSIGEAACAALLAWLAATNRATPGVATAVVFVEGCLAAMRVPFHAAMTPDLLPRELLLAGSALSSAQYNMGRVVGPALAGVVVAVGGFDWAFGLNAVSFFAVIGAVALIRLPPRSARPPSAFWGGIVEGARVLRSEPGCRAAVVLISLSSLLVAPFIALVAARAFELGDGGSKETARITGFLTAGQGVGAVVGAVLLTSIAARFGRGRTLTADLLLAPVALVAYAWAPSVPLAVAAMVLLGSRYIGILSGMMTVVQLRAPDEYRGRVLSLYLVALGVVYPVGGLIQGQVADMIGLPRTTTFFAVAMVVAVLAVRAFRPDLLAAIDDPEPEVVVSPAPQAPTD